MRDRESSRLTPHTFSNVSHVMNNFTCVLFRKVTLYVHGEPGICEIFEDICVKKPLGPRGGGGELKFTLCYGVLHFHCFLS
jgi:hypothetical protein